MENYIINTYVTAVISWATLFALVRNMCHKRSSYFCVSLVSTIHSFEALIMASLCIQDWTNPLSPLASELSPQQAKILVISLAFYSHETVLYLRDINNVGIDLFIHHLGAIAGICFLLAYGKYGSEAMAALWIGEFTTPFTDSKVLLKELGLKDTNLFTAVEILRAAAFTFARMLLGTSEAYVVLTGNYPLPMKVMILGTQLLCTFWYYKIISVGIYKYGLFKQRRISTEKIHSS